jgi:chorismate synthase
VCAPATNRHAGVLGGIATGMPVSFRVAFKPTASIARPQQTVRLSRMQAETILVGGRHDPCVVPRAVPVVEAMAALGILDLMMIARGRAI